MNTVEAQKVRGDQVRVGDHIVFLGNAVRVLVIEPQPDNPLMEGVRTAIGPNDWRMALYPDAWIEVVR